ncbi:unnamed protein product [Meloidogyne enterolobii]|uniref:Uncharacterized protein n=1 Tax=Meloidogyne enterolobii TaxID=390850 RepID=A0ACB0ZS77_MELEN
MERTKNIKTKCSIEIDSKSTTRLLKNLMNYIQFLLLCCPNLESIYFDLAFDLDLKTDFFSDSDSSESISGDSFYEISPEEYVTNLELFFSSIIDYLKNLKNGGKNLKIAVEFCSKFAANHYVLIPKNNKLFSMGKHMEIKSLVIDRENGNHQEEEVPAFIGRDIEVVDSIGRQHQCFVQIISEGPLDYLGYYINDDFFNGGHGFDANAYIDAYSLDPYDFYQC